MKHFPFLTVLLVSLGTLSLGADAARAGGERAFCLPRQESLQQDPRQGKRQDQERQQRHLAVIVKKMSQDCGATIECDSSIASVLVTAPTERTTAENFEKQIDALVTRLPNGTTWAKMYMPALSAPAATYNADALVGYAAASADLFRKQIGAALPPGTIEVLGRRLDADKAAAVAAALDLKAVYVIVGSSARRNSIDGHVQAILAMNPADRSAVLAKISNAASNKVSSMELLMKVFALEQERISPAPAGSVIHVNDDANNGGGSDAAPSDAMPSDSAPPTP